MESRAQIIVKEICIPELLIPEIFLSEHPILIHATQLKITENIMFTHLFGDGSGKAIDSSPI